MFSPAKHLVFAFPEWGATAAGDYCVLVPVKPGDKNAWLIVIAARSTDCESYHAWVDSKTIGVFFPRPA